MKSTEELVADVAKALWTQFAHEEDYLDARDTADKSLAELASRVPRASATVQVCDNTRDEAWRLFPGG